MKRSYLKTVKDGILSEPLDVDATPRRGLSRRDLFIAPGMVLEHRPSATTGTVVRFVEGSVIVLRDRSGRDHSFTPTDGLFGHQGQPVALRAPLRAAEPQQLSQKTASGSISLGEVPARMARASRIYVEGIHDAELIERIWGDDLRYEGVVVQQLDGADDLASHVRGFGPRPGRRLGVLLDHLVDGSKESRLARDIDDPNVLIVGHPYVDIWQAIKPSAVGISAWPVVPKGTDWKTGVLAALGVRDEPGRFWKGLLGQVSSWHDLEVPLVTAVEQLIDFVTAAE